VVEAGSASSNRAALNRPPRSFTLRLSRQQMIPLQAEFSSPPLLYEFRLLALRPGIISEGETDAVCNRRVGIEHEKVNCIGIGV
jgi:hypothetical protein